LMIATLQHFISIFIHNYINFIIISREKANKEPDANFGDTYSHS